MTSKVGAFVVILGYVIVLFVLVRPGSQGPALVSNLTAGTSNIIKASTGGGTWSKA